MLEMDRMFVVIGVWVVAVTVLPAQTFTTLHSFDSKTDGANPYSGLVQGANGNLYGTTLNGADGVAGTIFKITPNGAFSTVYKFCMQKDCSDGYHSAASVVQATNGNFYGTTSFGGASTGISGSVFEVTPDGVLTTIYNFCPQTSCLDGDDPQAGVIQASNGSFYGTTSLGGANGAGSIFEIPQTRSLKTLYSFCSLSNCTDGANPSSALVQGDDGDFYGTTPRDGARSGNNGTVFKITPSGALTTLHSFCTQPKCPDGGAPNGLIQGSDGTFYGTTTYGGANLSGTVFKITLVGELTTLHSFNQFVDGASPYAGLVQGTDGNFYGTTFEGGTGNGGTIFGMTPSGDLTTLYSFCPQGPCTNGDQPRAGLVQDTNGDFYGTTSEGGTDGYGTVYRFSMGLGRFVEPQTTSGKVGSIVKILGTGLAGSTSVQFNGTSANFRVVSGSEIVTRVPVGASSGIVEVVTPGGTLSSNVAFRVLR